ncbi:MAG: hypothetical protein M3Y85_04705 [Bacteroidota bacterium]|nr:hypothetical protein [Bacteroidota bacterium]
MALKELDGKSIMELCLRLARYKKENKELLTFLLFEVDNLPIFIQGVNKEIDEGFASINTSNFYLAKKSLRKISRTANKYIRYAGDKTVEVEVLLHFCTAFKALKRAWQQTATLTNLYAAQIKKISVALDTLHEDLQYDYRKSLDRLVE